MGDVNIQYTIPFGSKARIGYKVTGSANPYTYITTYPGPEDSPYTITIPPGFYDISISTICPNCSGNIYSDEVVTQINVLT